MNDPHAARARWPQGAAPTHARTSRDDAGWRAAVLRDAGLNRREAHAIAARETIDVHELVSLVERGCPLHLALRIIGDGSERS